LENLNPLIQNSKKWTRSMITPEIAAFVVKEYLLPMFESDGRKLMNAKSKKGLTIDKNSKITKSKERIVENN